MSSYSGPNKQVHKERFFLTSYSVLAIVIGFFLSTFDILAHVKFLSENGYKTLAGAYIISGLLGLGSSYFFSILIRKVSIKTLSYLILCFVLVLAGSYIVLLEVYPIKQLSLIGIIIFFPVNMLLILGMWRYGRMLLSAKSTRRIFPVIKTSNFFGLALGGAFTTGILFLFEFEALGLFSFGALLLLWPCLFLSNYFGNKSGLVEEGRRKSVPFKNKLFFFFSSRFSRYLLLFAILSSLIGFNIHFVFINTAWAGFFTIVGMSKYYGLFITAAMVFIYGLDRYIVKRVLYSYDSPYSILVIPIIVIISLVLSIIGSLLLENFQPHEHFTLFFLLVAMVKVVFLGSLFAIQIPAIRTLFHALDIRFRQIVYSRIEGAALMIGLLISGLFILSLFFLNFYSLTIVLIITAVISILWLFIAIKLISEYRKAQDKFIGKMRFRRTDSNKEISFLERIRKVLAAEDIQKIIEALELTKIHQPIEYEVDLVRLISHPSKDIRSYVLDCIEAEKIDSTAPVLIEQSESAYKDERKHIDRVLRSFTPGFSKRISNDQIKHLVYSGSAEERSNLPQLIMKSDIPEKDNLLTTLTKDFEPSVRKAAVRALAHHETEKFSYALLDFIYPGNFDTYAIDAIAHSGDRALDYLERESMVPGTDDLVLARIMRIYGKIGSTKSINILLDKLGGLNDYLMLHSVQALIEHRFQANKTNKYRIQGLLLKLVSDITYNLHNIRQLKGKKQYSLLYDAFMSEVELNYQQLFRLLSLIYNPNVIDSLKRLFLKGSRTQINHALELADQYLDDEIKPLIFPLLEDLSSAERLKRLEFYFPQAKQSIRDIIESALTFDFNKLSQFPRACAMLVIYELKLKGFESELIFNASHPEQMLSETALFVLKSVYPKKFDEAEKTLLLDGNTTTQLPSIVEFDPNLLLFTRYVELMNYQSFRELSEFVALKLAKIARKLKIEKNERLSIKNLGSKYQLIMFERNVSDPESNRKLIVAKELIPVSMLSREQINDITASNETAIWLFDKITVTELLFDNVDLANTMLKGIEKFKIAPSHE